MALRACLLVVALEAHPLEQRKRMDIRLLICVNRHAP
jgi:hypothetical protein